MNEKYKMEVKVLDPRLGLEFPLPRYATSGSAGLDLRAMIEDDLVLAPGATALVSSGVSVFIKDPHTVGLITPRSGLGHKKGLVLGNLTGVIDSDYTGDLKISLWNRSSEEVVVQPGDAVAQLLLIAVRQADLIIVESFSEDTVRGAGGFGHTGQ